MTEAQIALLSAMRPEGARSIPRGSLDEAVAEELAGLGLLKECAYMPDHIGWKVTKRGYEEILA